MPVSIMCTHAKCYSQLGELFWPTCNGTCFQKNYFSQCDCAILFMSVYISLWCFTVVIIASCVSKHCYLVLCCYSTWRLWLTHVCCRCLVDQRLSNVFRQETSDMRSINSLRPTWWAFGERLQLPLKLNLIRYGDTF